MRPANIVTAIADILAGVAISNYLLGDYQIAPLIWLMLSTIGLYGGGVVFNDVFDAPLDRKERPERPIPSGLISIREATTLASTLLLLGVLFAILVSFVSGIISLSIAIAAVVYDKWGKHHDYLGPVNMGLCRGLNLLLGISIVPPQLWDYWFVALVPIVYIAAITMISRGEVYGGRKSTLYAAAIFYLVVMIAILTIAVMEAALFPTLFLLTLWAGMILFPLQKAIVNPQGPLIGKAVKAGVIALIIMNAAWATAFGQFYLAGIILLLLPVSLGLAKAFAVT